MICQNCGTKNRVGAKFCMECAAPLAAHCPTCGAVNAPTAKFCSECATSLAGTSTVPAAASADPGSSAERRLVSVLFADLVGFTPFAEERDAEETREMLSRYFEVASEVVARYGGTVEKFIGDAVMAVWGTPIAHEDDAERSVRAGLELVDAVRVLGPTIRARAGVVTGEAAVTIGATNQGMVAGDMVNTAARLQSIAAPGTVLVGESTVRATEAAIAYEPLGDQALKGKSVPIPAWRAVRVVAERGGRNRPDLEAPFVGRVDELRLLKDLFHATGRERRTRLVSVVGPAGIGKSRLAWEFTKYLDGLAETIYWHDGRSPSYGEGVTFWALGEMVRGRVGLVESDDEATTRQKVADSVNENIPDETERRWIESALLALLGLETSLAADQMFAAWRTFFERLAINGPVVMVFEDLHWADSGTIDFIEHLLDWSKGVPIYVVTLARPEFVERRPDWGAGKRNFVSMYLEPLPEDAMRELLAGLVPGLPESATRAIVERADGMPLYAVETVRMLVADGQLVAQDGAYRPIGDLSSLAVPETLTALIGARLDALEPRDRALVQHAAVLGQSFSLPALAAVMGEEAATLEDRLAGLVRRELLRLQVDLRSPERGQYLFVQALIREVAYNTLSKKDRKAGHLAAARYFEALGTDELAGALADHYLSAHTNSPDGPEADAVAAQARIALRGAAERAAELGAFDQAAAFYIQARQITADPGEIADLLERAGVAAEEGGHLEDAETYLREALEIIRVGGDDAAELRATVALARSLVVHFKVDETLSLLEMAVDRWVAPGTELDQDRVAFLAQFARVLFFHEDNPRALEVVDRALPAAEHLDALPLIADLLITRGSVLSLLGRAYEGLGSIRAGMHLADANGMTAVSLRARVNLTAHDQGDPRMVYEVARDALETAIRLGRHGYVRVLLANAGSGAIEVGEWDWAIEQLEAELEAAPDELGRIYCRWGIASLTALRGLDIADEVGALVAWARDAGDSSLISGINQIHADLAMSQNRPADACDFLLAAAGSDTLNAPASAQLAGSMALIAGDAVRADRALAMFDATDVHGTLWDLDRRLIRTGIAALTAPTGTELRSFQEVIGAYREMGLLYRQSVATTVLVATRGGAEAEVTALADEAQAILERLGAKPLLRDLERARSTSGTWSIASAAVISNDTAAAVRG